MMIDPKTRFTPVCVNSGQVNSGQVNLGNTQHPAAPHSSEKPWQHNSPPKALQAFAMDSEQQALYQRLQQYSLDVPGVDFSFSQRLARENGWSIAYAQRVIEEYKKFAFLAVAAGHHVTPSDQVDQVWHLHLLYTHLYWGDFCPNILQRSLHHGPTKRGP